MRVGGEVRKVAMKVGMIMTKKAFRYDIFSAFPEGGQPLEPL